MNKLFLNMVMLPGGLWRSMGADLQQLKALLDIRLKLDDRKPSPYTRGQKKAKNIKYGSIINIVVAIATGCLYVLPLAAVPDRIFSLTLYFSLLLTLISFMLIIDFSSVLFDARDKYILFPRPINDATLVLARMLHVFIYLFRIVLPMALPGWIALGIADGWKSAVLFPVIVLMLVFMVLFFVNGVYLIVLRLAKPEKFKDVLNYFQVVTSVIIFASVYLLPRVFKGQDMSSFSVNSFSWARYLPSYWLASSWSWIGYTVPFAGTQLYSILAIAAPLTCMYVLVRWLSPQFSRRIAGIDSVEAGTPAKTAIKQGRNRMYQRLANMVNRTDEAKAGFAISWLQSSRSRNFRMKVYPTFAYIPVYFVYMLTNGHSSMGNAISHLAERQHFSLLLLYMSSFVLVSAITYLTISDQYKAAWVYYALPISKPGLVMTGALKALWLKYFLPFFVLIGAFVIYVWGTGMITDVLLALVNVSLFVSCIARMGYRLLPFSTMEQAKQRAGSRFLKSMLVMIIPSSLGFGHYFALHLLWLKLLFLVLSSIMLWLVVDSYANTSWENVYKTNEE